MGWPSDADNPSKKNRCIKWFNNSPSLARSMPERERKLDTSLEPPLPGVHNRSCGTATKSRCRG